MTAPTWKPIRYDLRQVALMVAVAQLCDAGFAQVVAENTTSQAAEANGLIPPAPAVLAYFGLVPDGAEYVWNSR